MPVTTRYIAATVEDELGALGCALANPAAFIGRMHADLFGIEAHRVIARLLAEQWSEHRALNPRLLVDSLASAMQWTKATADAALCEVVDFGDLAESSGRVAFANLERAYRARLADDAVKRTAANVANGADPLAELSALRAAADDVLADGGEGVVSFADLAGVEPWTLADVRIRTGLGFVDDDLLDGGLTPGGVAFIVAAPAVGKSALMLQMLLAYLRCNPNDAALWCFGEMNPPALWRRALANLSGLHPAVACQSPERIDPRFRERRDTALATLRELAPRWHRTPTMTPGAIRAAIESTGARLAFVDYFQLLRGDGPGVAENETARLGALSAELVRIAHDTGAALVVASSVAKGDGPARSAIDTIRGSGSAAHDAHLIAHGHRPDETDPSRVTWRTVKNRSGRLGSVTLRLDGPACRFAPEGVGGGA